MNKLTYRSFLALAFIAGLLVSLAVAQISAPHGADTPVPAPIIVDTPAAPHPKARVRVIDLETGTIKFDWLDAAGNAVDTGNSLARITVTGESITPEQKAILAAGITAATQ